MKTAAAALLLLAALAVPAVAGPCQDDLPKVATALAAADLTADAKTQLQDMVNQATELCRAGNEEEAADVLAEAASLLGMD
ncbi:hypothetical protein [Aestuariivirga sp.]|uniref:hypothetical protein n=1 Tax=Aestuariivirga sp. TaxID=2650926 RepID=UPI00391CE5AC